MLSLATLLPEPAILPSTPITDHCSDASITPRTPSTPATHPEELPTSAALLDYLIYRLLHPLLQVLYDRPSNIWCYATADVIRLVESLREHKNEEVTVDCVAGTVQAIVQAGRCLAHPTSLPQVHRILNVALRKVAGETVLDSSVLEVIENLSSSDSVSEQRWDVASSSWQPWTSPSDMKSSSTASAVHVLPTADAHRLAWLLQQVIPVSFLLSLLFKSHCLNHIVTLLLFYSILFSYVYISSHLIYSILSILFYSIFLCIHLTLRYRALPLLRLGVIAHL
ncbi:hypothetical protein E2C01_064969 [Portunus trituberculatus]|uniref:Uncharacterized protein n=1 Tax=Portunus trituberculatus TaxID=210409 RepID=A0A5B7HM90_PORTR|nr:hypothetical protein [Portunus trituberculatus]